MASKGTERSDEEVLEELKARYTYATNAWKDIRKEAQTDMRYVSGDPWAEKDRKAREAAGRPCLSLDELGQFVNQIINDVRQNKRGIKVAPKGEGANDKSAELRQDLIREIEYRSNGQQAYTTMFENAVQRSYGYLRIKAQYVSDKSFDQELLIEALMNPDLVTPDPDALRPDGSDIKYAFIEESFDAKRFEREFPDAEKVDFKVDGAELPQWVKDGERIMVAEYWTIETRRRRLLLLAPPPVVAIPGQPAPPPAPPVAVFLDELEDEGLEMPPATQILKDRWVDAPYVCQYLTNGKQLLAKKGSPKKTEWPGTSIPLVSCVGKALYFDDGGGMSKKLLSMVRLARDPYMLYCYYRTCEAELVGMTPKTPFIGYAGQFRGFEEQWQKVAHEPVAFLEANPMTEGTGQQVLPLPMRQPYDPPIQALEVGAESARRAIQAAMGTSPLPTQAQKRNEKSGVALQRMEDSAQRGSYHFIDHYDAAITRTGAILDELIPFYYDTARDVTVRKPDDSPEVLRINDPAKQDSPDATAGTHDVTISVGPAYQSQREAAEDFADTLIASPVMQMLGPDARKLFGLAVKLKNVGPLGDEMADIISPPQAKEGEPPTPEQVQAMQQQMQQMQQQLQQAAQFIETEQAKQQAVIQKAQIEAERDLKLAEMQGQIDIQLAVIGAQQKAKAADQQTQAKVLEIGVDAAEAERDRQHEDAIARMQAENQAAAQGNEHAHSADMAKNEAAQKAQESKK
jgi:hypothetical protein